MMPGYDFIEGQLETRLKPKTPFRNRRNQS